MGQRFCLQEERPANDDDTEAQLVDSEDNSATFAVNQESGAGTSNTVPRHASPSSVKTTDAGVGDTMGAVGADATGDASQAANAAAGAAISAGASKQIKSKQATGKATERREATSKKKKAVAVDRVSEEPGGATTTKTPDDSPTARKVVSIADVHKPTGLLSENLKADSLKSGAAGQQKKHGDKLDDQEDAVEVGGTAVKGAHVAVAQKPSPASESSGGQVSHTDVRTPPTGGTNASPAESQRPRGERAERNAQAASANQPTTPAPHSLEDEEEALRLLRHEARMRALVHRTWRRSTATLCVLLVLAAAIASVAFKTSRQRAHLLKLLDVGRLTNATGGGYASDTPLFSRGNETIFGEPNLDQPLVP